MSSESLKSLIVTDPSLLDEGIDVSGLRTETDTNPRLLASIADFPGISYDPTSFDYLSDLNELFAYGLPGGDTSGTTTPPVTTTPDTGGGGQETSPSITDTIPELSSGAVNTAEEQRLIDAGIGVQGAPGDPVVAPGEIPVTQAEMDEFNRIPVTPVSPTTQPIDPTGMLPQTSTPYMVEGALGVDPREKMDFITAEDAADPTFLDRIGLGQFNPVEAFVKAALNKSIGLPISFLVDTLVNTLPPQDPRQVALNEFYDVKDGTIQSGLMTGYNPVSGNPLDPTYGLQEAYQKRLDTINKTLGAMTLEEYQNTDLVQRKKDIEEAMAKEKARLDLFSGDVDERDQMLEDISLQNKIDAGIQAAEDDKGSEMLDTSTGVNPFADIDTGVGEFDTTPVTDTDTTTVLGREVSDGTTVNRIPDYITDSITDAELYGDTTPSGAIPPGEIGGPGYIEPPMTLADDRINRLDTSEMGDDLLDISQDAPTTPTEQEQIEAEYRELQRIAEQIEADQRFAEQAAIERSEQEQIEAEYRELQRIARQREAEQAFANQVAKEKEEAEARAAQKAASEREARAAIARAEAEAAQKTTPAPPPGPPEDVRRGGGEGSQSSPSPSSPTNVGNPFGYR